MDKANVLGPQAVAGDCRVGNCKIPDVAFESMLVDNCSMQLVRRPNCLMSDAENMFGDILSDEAACSPDQSGCCLCKSGRKTDIYEPVVTLTSQAKHRKPGWHGLSVALMWALVG